MIKSKTIVNQGEKDKAINSRGMEYQRLLSHHKWDTTAHPSVFLLCWLVLPRMIKEFINLRKL